MKRVEVNVELNPEQIEERRARATALKHDPRVVDFLHQHQLAQEFVDAHVQRFSQWLENLDRCHDCPGLHACTQPTSGYVMELVMDPELTWQLKPCRYMQERLVRRQHRQAFVRLDAPEAMLEADVRHLLDVPADTAYKQAIKNLPAWFNQPTSGFYFHGPLGSGKTHLAMAILNHFAKLGQRVAFVSVPELSRQYYSSYQSDEHAEHQLARLIGVDVLVLDDLGAETYSSFFRDDVLFHLLNQRMNQKRLSLFTSNHPLDALLDHYRVSAKGDDEPVKAARLLERIQALATPLLISGRNRRL